MFHRLRRNMVFLLFFFSALMPGERQPQKATSIWYSDLEEALETSIDLVTLDSMEEPTERPSQLQFREAVKQERKMIYAAA